MVVVKKKRITINSSLTSRLSLKTSQYFINQVSNFLNFLHAIYKLHFIQSIKIGLIQPPSFNWKPLKNLISSIIFYQTQPWIMQNCGYHSNVQGMNKCLRIRVYFYIAMKVTKHDISDRNCERWFMSVPVWWKYLSCKLGGIEKLNVVQRKWGRGNFFYTMSNKREQISSPGLVIQRLSI